MGSAPAFGDQRVFLKKDPLETQKLVKKWWIEFQAVLFDASEPHIPQTPSKGEPICPLTP